MLYSDCNCMFGNAEKDICNSLSYSKDVIIGILGVFFGLLTTIVLYCLFECVFNGHYCCCTYSSETAINAVRPQDDSESNDAKTNGHSDFFTAVQTENKELVHRHRKCYACHIKHTFAGRRFAA